jgi:hypothetical protein
MLAASDSRAAATSAGSATSGSGSGALGVGLALADSLGAVVAGDAAGGSLGPGASGEHPARSPIAIAATRAAVVRGRRVTIIGCSSRARRVTR